MKKKTLEEKSANRKEYMKFYRHRITLFERKKELQLF